MKTDNVTPIHGGAGLPSISRLRELDTAQSALFQARAIVDVLQGAAAHGALEPPSNEESLARTLSVVLDLLDRVQENVFPSADTETAEETQP